MSDYDLYKLIKQHWSGPMRQHIRAQRRPELTATAMKNFWNEFNIEFREYFKQCHKFLMGCYDEDTGKETSNLEHLAQKSTETQGKCNSTHVVQA